MFCCLAYPASVSRSAATLLKPADVSTEPSFRPASVATASVYSGLDFTSGVSFAQLLQVSRDRVDERSGHGGVGRGQCQLRRVRDGPGKHVRRVVRELCRRCPVG